MRPPTDRMCWILPCYDQAGLIDKKNAFVKVLANGELSKSLTVAVDKVSGGAKKKIEAAGGTVEVSA